jgi:eukaryotic-like serine/threonine-protein kinase
MSEVHRGFDTVLLRAVAIKLLREIDRMSVARFEREARVLANLQHPNVVSVFDVGTDAEDRFIVMELVEGPTLRDVLDEEERLEPDRAVGIAADVATALAYAHDRDVVHRDVKPSNVLMAPGGRVKLADLGIAKLLNAETLTTRTGLLGSANYIAPEQVRGGPIDGRADLYSLGCVLFEMLVGRRPFRGHVGALAYAHLHTPAPRLRSLDPALSEPLDALVASLLEKEPAGRPQSAAEVRTALRRATGKSGSPAPIAIPPSTRPDPTMLLLPEPPEPRPPIERVTLGEPTEPPGTSRRPPWIRVLLAAAAAIVGLLLLMLLAPTFAPDRTPERGAELRSPHSSSPSTRDPQSSPPTTSEPSPEPSSSREAAQHVVDVVIEGVVADEITGKIVEEVSKKIEEAFRELDDHEDVDKALEKIAELQDKVGEAYDKGEISSAERTRAITDALDELSAAIEAEAVGSLAGDD